MAVSLTICILNAALPALQSLVLVRTAAEREIARYLLVSGWVTFAATVAICGFELLPVKMLPKLQTDGKSRSARTFARFATCFVGGVTAAVQAVFLGLLCAGMLPFPPENAFLAGAVLLLPTTLLMVMTACLRGAGGPIKGNVLKEAGPHLLFLLLLLAQGWLGEKPDAARLVATAAVSSGISFLVACTALWRALHRPPTGGAAGKEEPPAEEGEPRQWLLHGLSLAVFSIVFSLHNNLGVLVLGLFGRQEDIPVFVNFSRLAALASLGLASVNTLLAPVIARLYHTGETAALQAALRHSCTKGLGVWGLVVASVAFFRLDSYFTVPGRSGSQEVVLALLLAAQFVFVATGACGLLLTMTEHQGAATRINLLAVAMNFLLAVLLVPRFGAAGAALGSFVAVVYANVHLAWVGARRLGVDPSILSLLVREEREEVVAGENVP